VVFSDFECPFCARLLPTLRALETRYGSQVRLAFRNLPLPFHTHAHRAAQAAMAAHAQGKFWAMHDQLFEHGGSLETEDLERWAAAAGLDLARFRDALSTRAFAEQVDADLAEAERIGARGTPTTFVNGRAVQGAHPLDVFVRVIDEELAKSRR